MFQPSNEIYRTVHLALFPGNNEPLDYIMPIKHFQQLSFNDHVIPVLNFLTWNEDDGLLQNNEQVLFYTYAFAGANQEITYSTTDISIDYADTLNTRHKTILSDFFFIQISHHCLRYCPPDSLASLAGASLVFGICGISSHLFK